MPGRTLIPDSRGWPYDEWQAFLTARAAAIDSMRKVGHSYEEIVETLNLGDADHAKRIAERNE